MKFYEKGERPLEIVTTRQWYIRNGGRDADLRDALIARGREIQWVPEHMRHRYENWVEGLNGDWLISRQRFFGVPVPGLVPAGRRGRARLHHADPGARGLAAGRPVVRRAGRVHRGPARQAGRVHRRPRRHGHLGDVVAVAAGRLGLGHRPGAVRRASSRWTSGRRRTTSSAPGCSPPSSARTSSTARCRGRTPRSPASSSTPTARRCRSRRATRRRRSTSWSATAPTPSAGGPPVPGRVRTRRSTRRR